VKALYGSSFVPPTPTQLYAVPLRFDGGILGNSQLKEPDSQNGRVAGCYKAKEFLDVAVNGFYTAIDNRIEFEAVGNQIEAKNLTTSHSWGFELSSNLNRKPIFARLAGSYQNTTSDVPTPTPLWWNRLYAPNVPAEISLWASRR